MSKGLLLGIVAGAVVMQAWAPRPAHAAVENVTLAARQEIVSFPSSYDGTQIVGVWATPSLQAQVVDGRGSVPVVILLHGYTSLFQTGHRPIDFNQGTTSETDCDFRFSLSSAGQLALKSYYQDLIDFFVARGVAVFAPDSFSGRCVLDFRARTPPGDALAHPYRRAGDAYASLQYLATTHRYVDSHRVAVVGVSHGGSAAMLAVSAVDRMTRAPFAPSGYSNPSYGYEPPPASRADWRFAAAVGVGAATGFNGYLGSNKISVASAFSQAAGLYGTYAPLMLLCGRFDTGCYEPSTATTYGKFDSLLQKAAATTPEVDVDYEIFQNAGSDYLISTNDADYAGNAAARQATYEYLESWLLPRIAGASTTGNAIEHVPLPAGQHVVSFISDYDGAEILGVLAVPQKDAVTVNGRRTQPAVILLHGSGGLFRESPLDYHVGDPAEDTPSNCYPVFSPADYDAFELKSVYQTMVDHLVARGVIVFLPDSFSGRCLRSFQDKDPPEDAYAHPFKRAQDAYAALDYLLDGSIVDHVVGDVGVAGYSHGGSGALLAVADVEAMTTCPFAPRDYTAPKWGYEPPPTPTVSRHFTAGVNFYGGMGFYGYLGTNRVDRGREAEQAAGLYGNYAPLLMVGGSEDDIYYEPDDPADDEYAKFTSFLLKAQYTTPDVPLVAHVFQGAGHRILEPSVDATYPANTAARKRIYGLLATWFLPRLQFLK